VFQTLKITTPLIAQKEKRHISTVCMQYRAYFKLFFSYMMRISQRKPENMALRSQTLHLSLIPPVIAQDSTPFTVEIPERGIMRRK
jgi:hypothetical protein